MNRRLPFSGLPIVAGLLAMCGMNRWAVEPAPESKAEPIEPGAPTYRKATPKGTPCLCCHAAGWTPRKARQACKVMRERMAS